MSERNLSILQVNSGDERGGAAMVARNLHRQYQDLGMKARMAVGEKLSCDDQVFLVPNQQKAGSWSKWLFQAAREVDRRGGAPVAPVPKLLRFAAEPKRRVETMLGFEDFNYPGTGEILELPGGRPDVLHCHNLHGGFFDLRSLPQLSRSVPVVLTLHDAWLLSGHCCHSFECERWKSGCGDCPDLTIYPAIRHDATARNWRVKRDIFRKSRYYVITPCQWLMDKVQQSILAAGAAACQVIPNGIDLTSFHPGEQEQARRALELPLDASILSFAVVGPRQNQFKDWETQVEAIKLLATRKHDRRLLFLAIGERAPSERIGDIEIRFVPYERDRERLVQYYRASDLYVHAAKAETFPNTILEALACGIPCIASSVGGIPEMVLPGYNGMLVPPGQPQLLADGIRQLLMDRAGLARLGTNGVAQVQEKYTLSQQAGSYLSFYSRAVEDFETWKRQGEQRTSGKGALIPFETELAPGPAKDVCR